MTTIDSERVTIRSARPLAAIAAALAGDSRASLKARVILREVYKGGIRLVPDENGGLVAHWNQQVAAPLRAAGTGGSGGSICVGSL